MKSSPCACCWPGPRLILLPPPVQLQALESRVQELELRSARVTEERDSLRERLRALESSRQQLAEEFIILKSNYLALGRELDQEVREAAELIPGLIPGLIPEIPAPPHTSLLCRYLGWLLVVHPHLSSGPGRLLMQLYKGSC